MDILKARSFELPQQIQIEDAVIHPQQPGTYCPAKCMVELEIQLIEAMIIGQRITTVVVREIAATTKTGDRRYHAAWPHHSNLFTQTLRRIAQNSQESLAGDQIEGLIRVGDLVGIALS